MLDKKRILVKIDELVFKAIKTKLKDFKKFKQEILMVLAKG